MAAGRYSFVGEQGSIFHKVIGWVGPDGSPVDLSGYFASMYVRTDRATEPICKFHEFNGKIKNGRELGTLTLYVPSSEMALLTKGSYKYDLELRQWYAAQQLNSTGRMIPSIGHNDPTAMSLSGSYIDVNDVYLRCFFVLIASSTTFDWGYIDYDVAQAQWDAGGWVVVGSGITIVANQPYRLMTGFKDFGVSLVFSKESGWISNDYWNFYGYKYSIDVANAANDDVGTITVVGDYEKPPNFAGRTVLEAPTPFYYLNTAGAITANESGTLLLTASGPTSFVWPASGTIVVTIDGIGSPNTFKWSLDGVEQATGVSIDSSQWQSLGGYIHIRFNANTGGVLDDNWTFTARRPVIALTNSPDDDHNEVFEIRQNFTDSAASTQQWGGGIQFSRAMRGSDLSTDDLVLTEMTIGAHYALRLLQGSFRIDEEMTYDSPPVS